MSFDIYWLDDWSEEAILKIVDILKDVPNFKIIWFYHEDDEDMQEAGEYFAKTLDCDFQLQTK